MTCWIILEWWHLKWRIEKVHTVLDQLGYDVWLLAIDCCLEKLWTISDQVNLFDKAIKHWCEAHWNELADSVPNVFRCNHLLEF